MVNALSAPGTTRLGFCRAFGDVDRSTASFFDGDLRDVIDNAGGAVVSVDLSGVRFIDSSGYRVLLGATAYAIRNGHLLVLHDPSPSCAMSIRRYDVNHELRIERSCPTSTMTPAESTPNRGQRGPHRQA